MDLIIPYYYNNNNVILWIFTFSNEKLKFVFFNIMEIIIDMILFQN